MSIGTTNIRFSDLKTKYQSKSGVISTTTIRLSDFRGALFTDKTYIADNDQTYSINSQFKGKTFSDKPYLTYHSHQAPNMLTSTFGEFSAASLHSSAVTLNHNDDSRLILKVVGNGNIFIQMSVNSEEDYDHAYLYILSYPYITYYDVHKERISGEGQQTSNTAYAVKANHYVIFRYKKDGSVSEDPEYATWYINHGSLQGYSSNWPPSGISIEIP